MFFLEFKNIKQSKIKNKEGGKMGKKLFRVDFNCWCKLEKYQGRVEMSENARDLHISRMDLIRDTPVEIELGSFHNIGRQFKKRKYFAQFPHFLSVGGLFFTHFWL